MSMERQEFAPQQEMRADDKVAKQTAAEKQLADAFGELLPGEQAVIANLPKEMVDKITAFISANPDKFSSTDKVKDYLSEGASALLRADAMRVKEAKPANMVKGDAAEKAKTFGLSEVTSLESAKQALEGYFSKSSDAAAAIEEFNFAIAPLMGGGVRATPEKFQEIVGGIIQKHEALQLRKQQGNKAA